MIAKTKEQIIRRLKMLRVFKYARRGQNKIPDPHKPWEAMQAKSPFCFFESIRIVKDNKSDRSRFYKEKD